MLGVRQAEDIVNQIPPACLVPEFEIPVDLLAPASDQVPNDPTKRTVINFRGLLLTFSRI